MRKDKVRIRGTFNMGVTGASGGGGGGGGVGAHASLTQLDYASAGHTGFAPIDNPIFTTKVTTPLLKVTTGAAAGNMLISNAAGDLSYLAAGATTKILVGGGAANPVWTTATGTGAPVRADSPVFTTNITSPLIFGGIAANDDIIIRSTSHATKTTSYVILQDTGGNVGINTTTPGSKLHIKQTVNTSAGGIRLESADGWSGAVWREATGDGALILRNNSINTLAIKGGNVSSYATPYVSQLTGWNITQAGAADFRYLYTDELHAKSFIADLEQALAGGQIICKSVAPLAAVFTIPAAGANATLVVESFRGFDTFRVFVNGDIIRLRQFARAGTTLSITDTWGTVVWASTDTDANTQTYTFTRSTAPNAGGGVATETIGIGTLALDYGTTGNGFLESNSIDGAAGVNSPYQQVVTWTTHPATGLTLRSRLGNLSGINDADVGGDLTGQYGLYAENAYLKGVIVANTGYIGGVDGWVISAGYIKDVAGTVGLSAVVTGGDDVRFWAGHATPASAPFQVTEAGALTATGIAELGTGTAVYDGKASNIAIMNADIWENAYDGDNSGIHVNRKGYDGGDTHFKDFLVYDGKGTNVLFKVAGSEGTVYAPTLRVDTAFQCNGTAEIDNTLHVTGITTLDGLVKTVGGLHVGGAADPGADNLQVDGVASIGGSSAGDILLNLVSSTKALCVSRMTEAQANAMTPTAGMIVYMTGLGHFYGYTNAWRILD